MATLEEPLLENENGVAIQILPLLFLSSMVCSSSIGMVSLKYAEYNNSLVFLVLGYALEGYAFLIYPVCMRFFPLRVIIVSWSFGCNLTAHVCGTLLFGENGGVLSLLGVTCNLVGVVLVAFAR